MCISGAFPPLGFMVQYDISQAFKLYTTLLKQGLLFFFFPGNVSLEQSLKFS